MVWRNVAGQDRVFRDAVDNCPIGVALLTDSGAMVYANPSLGRLVGCDPAELVSKCLAVILRRGEASRFDALVDAASADADRRAVGELTLVDSSAREIPVCVQYVGADHESNVCSQLFVTDWTERKRWERLLGESEAKLEHAERLAALGRLAVSVAHEINNPLAGVVLYGALLTERMRADDPLYEDLSQVVAEAVRCRDIVKDLLEYAHPSPVQNATVEINTVVETALRLLVTKAEFRRMNLQKELAPALPTVRGDPHRLRQVVINLLVNAADAAGDQGIVRVWTGPDPSGEMVRLEVEDNGPGIPEAILPRIFDPFYTTKTAGKGTGLGLAVSRSIVREHGGVIRVVTREGKGTSIFVDLPAAPVNRREETVQTT